MAILRTYGIRVAIGLCVFLFLAVYSLVHYRYSFTHRKETHLATQFLSEIAELERPSETWRHRVPATWKNDADELFYLFKIWFTEHGITQQKLLHARPVAAINTQKGKVVLDLSYGAKEPVIRCEIGMEHGEYTVLPSFPLNNCLYTPDYNRDGTIDSLDLVEALARTSQTQPPEI